MTFVLLGKVSLSKQRLQDSLVPFQETREGRTAQLEMLAARFEQINYPSLPFTAV